MPTKGCKHNVHRLGHILWATGKYIFCKKCGAYSCGKTEFLRSHCPGAPITKHLSRAHANLLAGLDPVLLTELGIPFPWPPQLSDSHQFSWHEDVTLEVESEVDN